MNKLLQKDISGSPVWQQIGKQGSLTEQYFVFANNAKQQISKPQILKNQPQSMVWDSAYRIGNIATDPRTWIYGTAGVEIANDVLNDSIPFPSTDIGGIFSIMDKINKNYVLPKLIEIEQNKEK